MNFFASTGLYPRRNAQDPRAFVKPVLVVNVI